VYLRTLLAFRLGHRRLEEMMQQLCDTAIFPSGSRSDMVICACCAMLVVDSAAYES
jgi:hypothetical protein